MVWQGPASHPLHIARALSELIKRHFFTSPDAREKGEEKKERRKEPEGGILLSLYSGLLVNEDFSQCPRFFSLFFFSSSLGKKGGKNTQHFPSRFTKLFLPYQKQLSSGEECACRIITIPGAGKRSSQIWLASGQPTPPRSGNEKCNFSLPAVRLNP